MDFVYGMVGTSWLEWIGAATGLAAVILTIRRSIWTYAFGIPCVVIYAWLFYQWGLYSQTILYIYYIFMLSAGVHWWLKGRGEDGLILVERSSLAEIAGLGLLAVALIWPIGWVMETYAGATLPYLDASTTLIAALGQYLQSRRRVETYAVWTVVNLLSIWMFHLTGNLPTMALYGIYLALGLVGLVAWVRAWRTQTLVAA